MGEVVWKKDENVGTQPSPTWATYAEAMNKFSRSATAFMQHVHLLTEARTAYQEAMTVGADLRNRLDSGEQTLRALMSQLEKVVNDHLSDPGPDRKKPELVKNDPPGRRTEGERIDKVFP